MIQALGKNIIVKPVYEVKIKLILTPEEEEPIYWEVISIGKGVDEIVVGDRLLISPYHSREQVKFENETLYYLPCESVYAKLI